MLTEKTIQAMRDGGMSEEAVQEQIEISKFKIMETATVSVDCLVYNKGADQTPRFITIVADDGNADFVDDDGKASDEARLLIAQAMQTQAILQGATKISKSGCVDIGNLPTEVVNAISNDSIHAFDEGSKLWLDGDEMDDFMLEEGLLLRDEDLRVTAPISTAGMLSGQQQYREPLEALLPLVVDSIVNLINSKFPFMTQYTGFIMTLIKMSGGVNNISKKHFDKIFTDVQAKLG